MLTKFLRQQFVLFIAGIFLVSVLFACQENQITESPTATVSPVTQQTPLTTNSPPVAYPDRELTATPAQLPKLPYAYNALEKAIDAETMKLHHDRHHATYVNNLNEALQKHPELKNRSVEAMLRDLNNIPEDIRETVRNNGGGHLNHTIFWQIMSPNGGGQPTGEIAQQINQTFGSFDAFRKQFNEAGGDRFGSGWVWLVRNAQNQLQIVTTANQDSPIMDGLYPIMGNDVWEHAYYLRYQNRRPEYLNNWWNVVNWTEINRRSQAGLQQKV
ncbi:MULTISPECIES: superoxide dismutase [Calothrix]|uniref:superoxide dismutase n=2 Tax=Calothrix TaxID=1186 RepID=A0ABR8A6L8_9CYAN|nr:MULTISPECIES: superoxide dismutase [Calothrix]MBD2195524.1 superoxide dismutase [Calothrix parietina FACHB-288]MBD2228388.1 superoxide dismutase [Calothrix anomala FACHB-343]